MSLEGFGILLGVAGLAALVWRVWLDHQRKKKEATVLYLTDIRPKWLEQRKKLDLRFGTGEPLTRAQVETDVAKDHQLFEDIRELLSVLEYLCVGVNTGVFDLNIMYRASAAYTINIFIRLHEFIEWRRRLDGNPFLYVELESVVAEFQKRKRQKPDPRGKLRFWVAG